MRLARSFVFALALASLVGFRTEDTYALKHKVAKDETVTFLFSLHSVGEGTDVSLEGKSKTKIISVDEDGAYEAEVVMLEGKVNANGVETVMNESEPQTVKYDKNGKPVTKSEEMDLDGALNINLALTDLGDYEPKEPVKMGETWTKEGKYGDVTFKLEGKEKIKGKDCLKIAVTAKLNKKDVDGNAAGAYYLHADDFSVERSEFKLEHSGSVVETKMERVD